MKKYILALALLPGTGVYAQQKKAVFIIVDGISADVIEEMKTPALTEIAKEGKYLRAHLGGDKEDYSQTPTVSAVGYNSLITGVWYNKHNVGGNSILAPNYNYQNIFRIFKAQYPQKKTAIYSSWTDNRTKLVQDQYLDIKFDGYELDTVKFPQDKTRDFMERIDNQVATDAANSIRTEAPDLSWVYLEYTDDMGHAFGDSEQFHTAISKMDEKVGRIWKAIQYREKAFKEEWILVITTDHGRDERSGKGHGGQSPRQRSGWIVTNEPQLNNYAQYYYPGIVDIMPTVAKFINLQIPRDIRMENDGISLIGKVSVAQPTVNYFQNKLDVTWKAMDTKGNVKIWVTPTNLFKEGTKDDYKLLAEVPVGQEHVVLNVKDMPSEFYKVVLEGAENTVNRWWLPEDAKKQMLKKVVQ